MISLYQHTARLFHIGRSRREKKERKLNSVLKPFSQEKEAINLDFLNETNDILFPLVDVVVVVVLLRNSQSLDVNANEDLCERDCKTTTSVLARAFLMTAIFQVAAMAKLQNPS